MVDDLPKKDDDENISSDVSNTTKKVYENEIKSQQFLIDNAKKLTNIEKETLQILLDQQKARGEQAINTAKRLAEAKNKRSDYSITLRGYEGFDPDQVKKYGKAAEDLGRRYAKLESRRAANPTSVDYEAEFAKIETSRRELDNGIEKFIKGNENVSESVRRIKSKEETKTEAKASVSHISLTFQACFRQKFHNLLSGR